MNRQWNTVAAVAVALTAVHVGVGIWAFGMEQITYGAFVQSLAPLMTAWGGYIAGMLKFKGTTDDPR